MYKFPLQSSIKVTVQQYRNVYIGGQQRERSASKSLPPEVHNHTCSERKSGIKTKMKLMHKVITLSLQTVVMP